MKNIHTEIEINSSPGVVWNILTDFEKYPEWNPFIKSISGKKEVGETLSVLIQAPGSKGMTFKPIILNYNINKELRWKGKFLINGLFDGEHYFILENIGDVKTKFIHGENFSGILVGLFEKMLSKTKDGFLLMNNALKEECEKV